MVIEFTKYQAVGNDYVYVDCLSGQTYDYSDVARRLSVRRFGVGGDGAVFILPSATADVKMRIFNSDGSEGKTCGNALRCVADYLKKVRGFGGKKLTVETLSGIRTITETDGCYTVDMGICRLIETKDKKKIFDYPIIVDQRVFLITAVNVGNPHCVIFDGDNDYISISRQLQNNSLFDDGVNVEFVVKNGDKMQTFVYERGSGETLSCGSGACAVAFASVIKGICKKCEPIPIAMKGGTLTVTITDDYHALLSGKIDKVFHGEAYL